MCSRKNNIDPLNILNPLPTFSSCRQVREFSSWLAKLPHEHKIVIAGRAADDHTDCADDNSDCVDDPGDCVHYSDYQFIMFVYVKVAEDS